METTGKNCVDRFLSRVSNENISIVIQRRVCVCGVSEWPHHTVYIINAAACCELAHLCYGRAMRENANVNTFFISQLYRKRGRMCAAPFKW